MFMVLAHGFLTISRCFPQIEILIARDVKPGIGAALLFPVVLGFFALQSADGWQFQYCQDHLPESLAEVF
jgi:hypothetical protein